MKKLSKKETKECEKIIKNIKKEVHKVVIGQEKVIDGVIKGLLCDGHILVEGVPGIAKTLLIKALGKAMGGKTERVQFTVDLLPTDIVGLTTYTPKKGFEVSKGPVFTNLLIADEINRSPPKTQSALLQAMQEKEVTIGKKTYPLPIPFFVMATENPLETSGVYPLPEAQVDRFLFKVLMEYPAKKEDIEIMERNTTLKKFEDFGLRAVTTPKKISMMQDKVKRVYISPEIKEYISEITHTTRKNNFSASKFVEWGGSPRASIGMFIASKAQALMNGRNYVKAQDVKDIAYNVLRHRIILSYIAGAKNITSDDVITKVLNKIPVP